MVSATSLLTFVALALSVAANPVIVDRSPVLSIPITRLQNLTSGHNVIASGLARAQNFRERITARDLGEFRKMKRQAEPVINEAVSYIASVGVGADNTQCKHLLLVALSLPLFTSELDQLIVDTGSSNTWVGADEKFTSTSTSKDTGDRVSVSYGSGEFSGTSLQFKSIGTSTILT